MIILEDMDFTWTGLEMDKAAEMWNKKTSIKDIAREFDRDPDEVLLLLLHLARQGHIDKRPVNIYGRVY